MAIENEDHLRYVYDCLLPGNPYTADVDDDGLDEDDTEDEEPEEEEEEDGE